MEKLALVLIPLFLGLGFEQNMTLQGEWLVHVLIPLFLGLGFELVAPKKQGGKGRS